MSVPVVKVDRDPGSEDKSFGSLDGSTESLDSPDVSHSAPPQQKQSSASGRQASPRICRLDANVYKKHYDRNISLRHNLTEKFLKPVIATNINKVDLLSQNISNYQTSTQEAIFQSRVVASNMTLLMKQWDKFRSADYLKEIKTEGAIFESDQQNIVDMDSSTEVA